MCDILWCLKDMDWIRPMKNFLVSTLFLATLMASVAVAGEGQWGDLRVQVFHDGPVPTPKTISIDKDTAVFGKAYGQKTEMGTKFFGNQELSV